MISMSKTDRKILIGCDFREYSMLHLLYLCGLPEDLHQQLLSGEAHKGTLTTKRTLGTTQMANQAHPTWRTLRIRLWTAGRLSTPKIYRGFKVH